VNFFWILLGEKKSFFRKGKRGGKSYSSSSKVNTKKREKETIPLAHEVITRGWVHIFYRPEKKKKKGGGLSSFFCAS